MLPENVKSTIFGSTQCIHSVPRIYTETTGKNKAPQTWGSKCSAKEMRHTQQGAKSGLSAVQLLRQFENKDTN